MSSPLGEVLVAEINRELAALFFVSKETLPRRLEKLSRYYPFLKLAEGHIQNAKNVTRLLNGDDVTEDIPISKFVFECCSDFRKAVYEQLLRIPRGCTKSYAEVAAEMGRPTAYRAVAQACGANVLCVIIPCHRVIASNGTLHGYGGGLDKKKKLLEMESSQSSLKK
nr:Methylated-DNA-[protein]-cysteine S-methyltransferase domain containing protein [Haemonchus contortus]